MKLPKQLVLAAVAVAGFFFAHAAVAQDISQTIHETDAGTVINLNQGQTIQFALTDNIPNTTSWAFLYPNSDGVIWATVTSSLQKTGTGIAYDYTQDPIVATGETFTYYGVKPGQTILVFYKASTTSTTNADGSSATAITDATHPLITTLTYIVNVNGPSAQ